MASPDELEWRLQERVKELNLLHATTRLLQSNRLPLQVVLAELAALFPPAWQFPDACQVRIRYDKTEASTPFWYDAPWKLTTGFTTSDGRSGIIELVYVQQMPVAAEGPFLAEERHLIDSVAELLAAYLERSRATRKGKRTLPDAGNNYHPECSALLSELPTAIEQDQLTLHYQPRVDLQSSRTIEVEALVRWQHPEHGLIYPDRFIWLAESTQLIDALTHWVLARALDQWHEWTRWDLQPALSINLSTRNLLDRTLRSNLLELAKRAGFPLELLTLEITESTIVADPARALRVLTDLQHLGIRFAMEDLGTGHASPNFLKGLPISRMNIDKALVMNFGTGRNAAIVRESIELAHKLDMQVTAKGVQDDATHASLVELGCDLAQGYLFSKPLPEEELLAWLPAAR